MLEHYWILIAFIAPTMWAISNIIDVYFVHSVYNNPYDGAIVSGLAQIVPWLFVVFGIIDPVHFYDAWPLVLAGGLFTLSLLFYFKSLFSENDAPLIQLLWNFNVPLTMFLSWIIFNSSMERLQYLGCFLVLIGIAPLLLSDRLKSSITSRVAVFMTFATIFLSLSMILSSYGYETLTESVFWSSYLYFSLGAFLGGIGLIIWRGITAPRGSLVGLLKLSYRYAFVFVAAEGLAVIGTMGSQRSLDLSPYPALVATIESLTPVIIIILSFVLAIFMSKLFPQNRKWSEVLNKQSDHAILKIISIIIIGSGIYLIAR